MAESLAVNGIGDPFCPQVPETGTHVGHGILDLSTPDLGLELCEVQVGLPLRPVGRQSMLVGPSRGPRKSLMTWDSMVGISRKVKSEMGRSSVCAGDDGEGDSPWGRRDEVSGSPSWPRLALSS